MADQHQPDGLSPEELEAETAEALPERAAMSTLSPAGLDPAAGAADAVDAVGGVGDTVGDVGGTVGGVVGGVGGTVGGAGESISDLIDGLGDTSLLDLDVNLDGDLDAAAPINAGVAANANAALPIDAAVSANTLSPDAQSLASANQDSLLSQNIEADAIANSNQDSTIGQGEQVEDPAPAPDPADQSHSLLDLDANIDLGLDLAAPIDAAVAANANIAAPIDAAVSANTLSPDATSVASAAQHSTIVQNIEGSAQADADQTSVIEQGEDGS
jgi:hypothetical protein